jgi:16S rRNA (cytidine1402-2'-O)-methyltransferase
MHKSMSGRLYVVATPIGNLEDITYRAVRVLGEADAIACEDTRQTRKLLAHYGIRKPTVSYHEHNETERSAELVERMLAGESIALVSDAGMPLVSDPGYRLVKAAVDAAIPVEPIPGPSAALTALAASGLPTDAFHFGGFLPAKAGQRLKILTALADEPATIIFYEAPHRILEALEAIEQVMGPRPIVVARELTKVHEEFLRGTPAEVRTALASRDAIKGEFTLLIGKPTAAPVDATPVEQAVEALLRNGVPKMDAIKQVARQRGLSKRQVYDQLLKET